MPASCISVSHCEINILGFKNGQISIFLLPVEMTVLEDVGKCPCRQLVIFF